MNIIPKHNNVLIKQQEESEVMYGSIIVSDLGKEKPLMGKIIAVGPGIQGINGWIENTSKVGETVIFPAFGGQRITVKGEEFLIYKDGDLLASFEEEN